MNITQKQHDKAQSLMIELKTDEIFINEGGEFFTSENLASLSVKGDKKKFTKISKTPINEASKDETTISEEEAVKKLKSTEKIDSLDYNSEMKPLITALKIQTEGNKKSTLIKALEDYKAQLING